MGKFQCDREVVTYR